jgi:hypothetical protein
MEIDADGRIVARIAFDPDDTDAAFEELETRYLGGEAAPHAHTWSVVAGAYNTLNRRELPAMAPDFTNSDHRRLIGTEPGDLTASLNVVWELVPDWTNRIEAVHRLSDRGAVVTRAVTGSYQGFVAEWRSIDVVAVDRDLLSWSEFFDEADIAAALARFDELNPPAAPRLENHASQALARVWTCLEARDWSAIAEIMAEDFTSHDHRRVVNAGVRHGRDVHITQMREVAEVGFENVGSTVIATRGQRLALSTTRAAVRGQSPDEIGAEAVMVVEVDADNRLITNVLFDLDDIDAAFEELDARYVAGEAAAYSRTWALIAEGFAAFNRREIPSITGPVIDKRRLAPVEGVDLKAYIAATLDLSRDVTVYIEAVHRLTERAAVITHVGKATSPDGAEAEWRVVDVYSIEGSQIDRCEMFDDTDLDAALARFDEINRPAPQLRNTATQTWARLVETFNRRELDALVTLAAADGCYEDRRKGLRDEGLAKREVALAFFEVVPGSWRMEAQHIAIRGSRLSLTRNIFRDTVDANRPITTELLVLTETGDDGLIQYSVTFDPDDIVAALAELDARYVAGEAATQAHTWSVITTAYDAFNRHEIPPTTQDFANIDHRRGIGFVPGDMIPYIRASFEVAPDINIHIEAVHRLSSLGAVLTQSAHGASQVGFSAEWRETVLLTLEGELINRCEIFDETDLDLALAKFDELSVRPRLLENAAIRTWMQIVDAINRRDTDAFLAFSSPDGRLEDRRKGLRASHEGSERRRAAEAMCRAPESWHMEVEPVAIRGNRLGLTRERWRDTDEAERPITVESLTLTEVTGDGLAQYTVVFDPDDINGATEELDARYISGEAAAHAHTWSAITRAFVAFDNHDLPSTTLNWIDRRRLVGSGSSNLTETTRAAWEMTREMRNRIEVVHLLNDRGAVVTQFLSGTSREGFDFEWRVIDVFTIEGDAITRCETFDEGDLDAALARFDELNSPAPQLENAAIRIRSRLVESFNRRDVNGLIALAAADARYEDRRRGLRDEGLARPEVARAFFEAAPSTWLMEVEPIAIRGSRLSLTRDTFRDTADANRPITTEILAVTEIGDGDLIHSSVSFDPDDINGAFAELTARWIASGEVAHPEAVESLRVLTEVVNRHDWDAFAALTNGANFVNHRQLSSPGVDTVADHMSSMRTMASLVPDFWIEQADVLAHSNMGIVSHLVLRGTSAEGAAIEIPLVQIMLVEADRVTCFEAFDANQRDLALARFDELNQA